MTTLYEEAKFVFPTTTKSSFAIPVLDYIFASPIFTIPDMQRKIPNASKQTIVLIVSKLQEAKIVEKISEGKGRLPAVYKFTSLLDLIS